MATSRESLHFAALLHNIGKLGQRSTSKGISSSAYVSAEFQQQAQSAATAPEYVWWSAQIMRELLAKVTDLDESLSDLPLQTVALHQPQPNEPLAALLAAANCCALGVSPQSYVAGGTSGQPVLQSVFQNLLVKNKPTFQGYPIRALELDRKNFPSVQATQANTADYEKLWEDFLTEMHAIRPGTLSQVSAQILFLLEKYTSAIPNDPTYLPDVSVFEHAKSTAAYAVCLQEYCTATQQTPNSLQADTTPFLLVGGDLSGIQAYIYDIVGKGAAKNLKGRSFYLQLIVDTIVQDLLDGIGLPQTHIIYSSGGGFYLLMPHTDATLAYLEKQKEKLTRRIREHHGVKLFLAIAATPISLEHVYNGTINTLWTSLTEKLSAQKLCKFSDFLATPEGYEQFFKPSEVGGQQVRDAVTGEEFGVNEKKYPFTPDDLPERDTPQKAYVKESTFEQIRLGKILRDKIDYLIISRAEIPAWERSQEYFYKGANYHFQPLGLGYYYYFVNEEKWRNIQQKTAELSQNVRVLRVNDTCLPQLPPQWKQAVSGFVFYGGNDLPRTENEDALYFDQLAGGEEVSFKRLGILRMDVDRLGLIFKDGFGNSKRTFSRYSTLSKSLDFFFKGYLNIIWKNNPDYYKNTFILYAGGDDLFILGRWDHTLAFAQDIEKHFRDWICHNPEMGISGGMALVTPKYPIAKAATESDREEKKAKGHSYKQKEKNALSFFGTPLSFVGELPDALALQEEMSYHVGKGGISKNFLSKIMSYHYMKTEQEKKRENPSWRWLSAYDIGRAIERTKEGTPERDFLERVKIKLFVNERKEGSKYTYLDLLHLAARWTELDLRTKTK